MTSKTKKDITETPEWEDVLLGIYEQLKTAGVKNTGKRQVSIFLGLVDDLIAQRKWDVLDRLAKDGILSSFKIRSESVKFGAFNELMAKAVCKVAVSLKEYEELLASFSLIPKYLITYDELRNCLLLNNIKLMRLQSEGNRYHFWQYILAHSNQKVSQQELAEYVKGEVGEDKFRLVVRKIVNDCGFTGDLKKIFFKYSSNTAIYFINPVTQNRLDYLGISNERLKLLEEQIANLRLKAKSSKTK